MKFSVICAIFVFLTALCGGAFYDSAEAARLGGGGGSLLDLILFGLLAYIGYRLYKRFRAGQSPQPAGAQGGFTGSFPFSRSNQGMNRSDAGAAWGAFGQNPGSAQPYVDIPSGFDVDEFLRGAKMAYTRLQQSWDRRDLDDIANFASPAVMNVLQQQLQADPNPSTTEIYQINAQLLGVEREGDEERAQVFFDVSMKENPYQTTPAQAREIWHFVRHGQNGNWLLDGLQQAV